MHHLELMKSPAQSEMMKVRESTEVNVTSLSIMLELMQLCISEFIKINSSYRSQIPRHMAKQRSHALL